MLTADWKAVEGKDMSFPRCSRNESIMTS